MKKNDIPVLLSNLLCFSFVIWRTERELDSSAIFCFRDFLAFTCPSDFQTFLRPCESVAQSLDGQRSHIRSFPPLSPQPTQQGSQPKQPAIDCLEQFQPSRRRRPSWRSCSGWRSLKQNSPCSVKRYIWLWSFKKTCDNYLPISMS